MDPHTKTKTDQIEMVQRRAARYVFNDYRRTESVNQMLQLLNWKSLQERRQQAKATMMFRIAFNLVALPTPPRFNGPATTRGNYIKYHVPYTRTTIYQKSFYLDTIRLWNSLPLTAECKTLDQFRVFINKSNLIPQR